VREKIADYKFNAFWGTSVGALVYVLFGGSTLFDDLFGLFFGYLILLVIGGFPSILIAPTVARIIEVKNSPFILGLVITIAIPFIISGSPNAPDVGKIVFASDKRVGSAVSLNFEIYSINADGSNLSNLSNNPGIDGSPAWSPDGSQIAFRSERDGESDIFVMSVDGSGQINLTGRSRGEGGPSWTANDYSPAWSPDGSKIVFVSYRTGNGEIFSMNPDGSGLNNISNNPVLESNPAWSPDGSRIAFTVESFAIINIHIMDSDGKNRKQLTEVSDVRFSEGCPAWSPDGTKIAFSSKRNSGGDLRESNAQLFVMNADGSDQTLLVDKGGCPSWSPDGARIAFSRSRFGKSDIYVINSDGTGLTNVTNTLFTSEFAPNWTNLP